MAGIGVIGLGSMGAAMDTWTRAGAPRTGTPSRP